MKDRIAQIMKSENMTQQDFAAALEISPSTLSSIFNDRTQPSLTIVNKIHSSFPAINLLWLLYGQGDMYADTTNNGQPALTSDCPVNGADSAAGMASRDGAGKAPVSPGLFDQPLETAASPVREQVVEKIKYIDKPPRRITEINVYFDDGTYEVFVPRKRD